MGAGAVLNGAGRSAMRRIALALILLAALATACGDDDASSTTTTGPTTTGSETTTSAPATTSSSSTSEPTTTMPATTTTLPSGATPVDDSAYCVRGTAPDEALNVRAGPGIEFEVVGDLAWNAVAVPAGGFAAADDRGRSWLMVGYAGTMGWAAAWHLEPAPCGPATIAVAPLAGPGMPDALAGSLVPWARVDETWVLALYTSSWGHPFALYLLNPQGDIYEVFSWTDLAERPFDLYDWRPDGKAVLVGVGIDGAPTPETHLIDLEARTSRTVAAGYVDVEGLASFTRPTGRDVVVRTGDAATEIVEVRRSDGSLFSTLLTRPRLADWTRAATWLYGLDGTVVVLGDGDGLRLLSNLGDWIRDLDAPGEACRPVRWWDEATILARCIPREVLAYLPNAYYWRLWLVPADGSPATALTALPADPVFVGDFGFSDAWQLGDRVYANWAGDCGAAGINLVHPDGTTEWVDLEPATASNDQIVGTIGSDLVVRRWLACDGSPAGLHLAAPDGAGGRDLLIPHRTETWGVIDALMLPDLP